MIELSQPEIDYIMTSIDNFMEDIRDGGLSWDMRPVDVVTGQLESMEEWVFEDEDYFDSAEDKEAARTFYKKYSQFDEAHIIEFDELIIKWGEQ